MRNILASRKFTTIPLDSAGVGSAILQTTSQAYSFIFYLWYLPLFLACLFFLSQFVYRPFARLHYHWSLPHRGGSNGRIIISNQKRPARSTSSELGPRVGDMYAHIVQLSGTRCYIGLDFGLLACVQPNTCIIVSFFSFFFFVMLSAAYSRIPFSDHHNEYRSKSPSTP